MKILQEVFVAIVDRENIKGLTGNILWMNFTSSGTSILNLILFILFIFNKDTNKKFNKQKKNKTLI